jgi:hypothetical protein
MIGTLKDVVHQVVHDSPIPPRQLAEELGMSYSMLMNAANPDLEEFKLPARQLIPLAKLTGDCRHVDYIEHALGRVAFELPKPSSSSMEVVQVQLMRTIKEFGDLASTSADALSDGKLTIKEAKAIEVEAFEMIKATMMFLGTIEARVR